MVVNTELGSALSGLSTVEQAAEVIGMNFSTLFSKNYKNYPHQVIEDIPTQEDRALFQKLVEAGVINKDHPHWSKTPIIMVWMIPGGGVLCGVDLKNGNTMSSVFQLRINGKFLYLLRELEGWEDPTGRSLVEEK